MSTIEDIKNAYERIGAVDFAGYEPPGGEGWRRMYETAIVPEFEKGAREAHKELQMTTSRRARRAAALAAMKHIVAEAGEWERSVKDEFEDKDLLSKSADIMAAASSAAETAAERIAEDDADIRKIEEEIKFFADFQRYIDADELLDRMLWAIYNIDTSRRVKVFRLCLKLLKVVIEAREALRQSKAEMKELTTEYTRPIFETLDVAYAKLMPTLVLQKKIVERKGAAAFDDPLPFRKTA